MMPNAQQYAQPKPDAFARMELAAQLLRDDDCLDVPAMHRHGVRKLRRRLAGDLIEAAALELGLVTKGGQQRTASTTCADRLAPAFAEALARSVAERGAEGASPLATVEDGEAEDGIKAIQRAVYRYLVGKPERVQAAFDALVNAERVHVDDAVDGASGVAQRDAVAVAAVPLTGVFACQGQHFLVDGQRLYTLDSLCLHGVLSPLDIAWVQSIATAVGTLARHAREHVQAGAAAATCTAPSAD